MKTYKIDSAHSSANFTVRHMMIAKVHGGFKKMEGTLQYDPTDLGNTKVEATVDATSIDTREAERDTHLKSEDFFNVEKYPNITFKSTKVEPKGDEVLVTGDLTIRGVTKEVTLEMEKFTGEQKDPWGNYRIGSSATGKIKRKDFGLNWNAALEAGGVLVGDEVKIEVDVQFVRSE